MTAIGDRVRGGGGHETVEERGATTNGRSSRAKRSSQVKV